MPASLLVSQEQWIYNYRKCFDVAAGFAVKFELNSNDMVAARVAVIRLRDSRHSFDLLYKFLGISLIRIIFLHRHPAILVLNHGDKSMFEDFVKFSNRWFRAVEILKVSTLYDELQVYHRGETSVCEGSLRGHV